MPARKKTKLEKFFSLNQHRKRFGASRIERDINTIKLAELKGNILNGTTPLYTHGSEKNLAVHLENLLAEFAGQSELLYYHAKLIVLIRRDYKVEESFINFQELWITEGAFLLTHLNTRWLISAADTYSDHTKDPLERSTALSISLLMNTIKLQETERFIESSDHTSDSKSKITTLQTERVDLFDGTSAFAVGTDDTLRNMRWRLDNVCKEDTVVGKILKEIFHRIQDHETVYSRFRKRHTRQKTAWW